MSRFNLKTYLQKWFRDLVQAPIVDEDIEYMRDVRQATLLKNTPVANLIILVIVLFFVVALIWAKYAIIDENTMAEGKVIPSSQIKYIQNLEGGIIEEIPVSEGQTVEKGQVIAQLDDVQFSQAYREKKARYYSIIADMARLEAQAIHADTIRFPDEVMEHSADVVKREIELFKASREALSSSVATLQRSYEFARQELEMTRPLVDKGVASQVELLRLERQVNELKGSVAEKNKVYEEQANQALLQRKTELAEVTESLVSLRDRMLRTKITSPVRGIIKNIHISTIGGVVKPGMPIMEIVPLEDTLLIEARVRPNDIAFIHPGQKATVQISAYDFSLYGGLDGKLEFISPDTIADDQGNSFYEIRVRTDKNFLGNEKKPLEIIPGMTAIVQIQTGNKSILDYLLKPILKAKMYALTER